MCRMHPCEDDVYITVVNLLMYCINVGDGFSPASCLLSVRVCGCHVKRSFRNLGFTEFRF